MHSDKLTDLAIRKALKTTPRKSKLTDGKGLFLRTNTRSPAWHFKYISPRTGKENSISFGSYPETPLKAARDKREEARKLIADGVDPSEVRKEAKRATANTFAQVAQDYIAKQSDKLSPRTITRYRWLLELLPSIASSPINKISAQELLSALRRIEARGRIETAHKTKELCGRVFMYGVASGLCEHNVAADLALALKPRAGQHLAAITDPVKVGALLRALDGYEGQASTRAALRLLPHVFLRPGELRHGRWAEIDWEAALWRVPAARMKMRREHLVPLSRQSLGVLRELEPITGGDEFIFPCTGPKKRPLSDNALNNALHGLGYASDVHVPHGFRSTASTLLHEMGYESRDIELQLAHSDSNKIRGIYNRAERIQERTKMMQQWSDYLDQLRTGDANKVVPFKKHA